MTNSTTNELQLTSIQRVWLQELGVDRAYLSRIARGFDVLTEATENSTPPAQTENAEINTVRVYEGESNTVPQSGEPAVTARSSTTAPQPPASLQEAINALRKAANIRSSGIPIASASELSETPISVTRIIPDNFTELGLSAESCRSCDLNQNRSRVVFGRGITEAVQWLVLADAPSDADDKTGVAIDSHAGTLLTEMLHSVDLNIDEHCYVTHMVKCRTLDTQGPTADEMQACSAYLLKQIELLQPQYILALGQQTANQLLGLSDDIDQLRSKIHHWKSPQGRAIPVVVSYHPASLLLRPQHKANAWRDLALVSGLTQSV